MTCNVGGADRTVRIVLGIVLLVVGFYYPLSTLWQTSAIVLGAASLVTGLIRYCPVSAITGFNTCAREEENTS